MTATDAILVYATYPALAAAEAMAQGLVERRLAASVNIVPAAVSFYRWEGEVRRAEEVVLIAKTRGALGEAVRAAIRDRHPYVVPSILFVPVSGGDPAYLAWLAAETPQ